MNKETFYWIRFVVYIIILLLVSYIGIISVLIISSTLLIIIEMKTLEDLRGEKC